MSTKIYNGMISTSTNVFKTAHDIRDVIQPWYNERIVDAVKHANVHSGKKYKDVYTLPPSMRHAWDIPIPEIGFDIAHDMTRLVEDLRKQEMRTFSELDFGINVTILKNNRGVKYPPLVLVFCENGGDVLRQKLKDAGIVEDYGYWDNSDRPDDISEEAWKQREKAWETLEWGMSPSESGVSVTPSDISARMAMFS